MMRNVKKYVQLVLAIVFVVMSMEGVEVHAATIEDATVSQPLYGIVDLDSGTLNVRQYATTSSDVVSYLVNYAPIMIVGHEGNFYRVQYDTSGHYGYVSKDFVYLVEEEFYLKADIDSGNLNMRSGEGTSYGIVASIPKNTSFAFQNDYPETSYVGIYGNVRGYTAKEFTGKYRF